MSKKILVVGATGITGTSFLQHCLFSQTTANYGRDTAYVSPKDWQYIGLTRRADKRSSHANLTYIQIDLLKDCTPLQKLKEVTHVVFAGFVPEPDPAVQLIKNAALFENCLNALQDNPVEHIVLLQGMKYYGSHKGRFKTPALESDPRISDAHYYYAQQDIATESGIDWTCLRPHVICGTTSIGTPQNILAVIGCYASLCKADGQPLDWPGSDASYSVLNQATDADLLAQSIVWALQSPHARKQSFNITNGDFFRWDSLWPKLADVFEMPCGTCKPHMLSHSMPGKASKWGQLVQRRQLRNYTLNELCDWEFADYILKTEWDVMASTIKIRQAGFNACRDTEQMYIQRLLEMRQAKILP